jgi:hypothetical protein
MVDAEQALATGSSSAITLGEFDWQFFDNRANNNTVLLLQDRVVNIIVYEIRV